MLPARGYSESERRDLARAIDGSKADVVVSGTPHDLAALLGVAKPVVRARYEYAEADAPGLWEEVEEYLRRRAATGA